MITPKCISCISELKLIQKEYIKENNTIRNHKITYECKNTVCKVKNIIIEVD